VWIEGERAAEMAIVSEFAKRFIALGDPAPTLEEGEVIFARVTGRINDHFGYISRATKAWLLRELVEEMALWQRQQPATGQMLLLLDA
jgi:hypothetical protein